MYTLFNISILTGHAGVQKYTIFSSDLGVWPETKHCRQVYKDKQYFRTFVCSGDFLGFGGGLATSMTSVIGTADAEAHL